MTEEFNSHDDEFSDELRSKTQIKQELKDIIKLGKQLSELSITKLKELPLNEEIIVAYETLSAIKGNEGKKRHFKYIGKLLRNIELEPVQAAYARHKKGQPLIVNSKDGEQLNLGLTWVDQMLADPAASEAFLAEYPTVDRQQLRQYIRNARKSKKNKDKFVHFLDQKLD